MKNLFISTKKVALALLMAMIAGQSARADEVVVKAGTPVPMQLVNSIDGKNSSVGQMVDFRVTSDIKVGGKTVVPIGSIAKGQVTRAKKNGLVGQAGEIQVNVTSVTAVDGTQIVLSGGTLTAEGKNKLVLSLFLCLFLKGGNGELPAGMACSPIVSGNTTVTVD